jgi:predicted nucleic acid-binding protein
MIYLDTSVVVALLTPEDRSPQALDWLEQCHDPLISSDWLITETHSALGIKQRHHGLSAEARQAAGEQFERLLQGGVELRSLDRGRFRQAADLLQDPALGLRAGDALHLAVALHSRCNRLASFDGRMLQAAAALGMEPALD